MHFVKKKIQFLQKDFEMQTNDLQSLVCILFVCRLKTLGQSEPRTTNAPIGHSIH
jgi:hypothetical protein